MSSTLRAGQRTYMQFDIPATELAAGTVMELVAPHAGYIEELVTSVETAIGTGGTIDVKTGDALAVTVAGLQQTIANSATKGTRQTTTATTSSTTRAVAKGDRIGIVPSAAFASAGAMTGHLVINTADTDPQAA